MNTLVLATANPNKVAELRPPLQEQGFLVKLQTEFFSDQVEEDGLSFIENALKKARFASAKTGLPAIADDSGLQVAALGGKPGIYSARYAQSGQNGQADEQANVQKLLAELGNLPVKQRQATYICAVAFVAHAKDETPLIGYGTWQGDILNAPRTSHGIGYDAIFWLPSELKTASEVPLARKLQVSHRAQAMAQVLQQLKGRGAL